MVDIENTFPYIEVLGNGGVSDQMADEIRRLKMELTKEREFNEEMSARYNITKVMLEEIPLVTKYLITERCAAFIEYDDDSVNSIIHKDDLPEFLLDFLVWRSEQ